MAKIPGYGVLFAYGDPTARRDWRAEMGDEFDIDIDAPLTADERSSLIAQLGFDPAAIKAPSKVVKGLIVKEGSYFADCPRDDQGHCKPSGQGDDAAAGQGGGQGQQTESKPAGGKKTGRPSKASVAIRADENEAAALIENLFPGYDGEESQKMLASILGAPDDAEVIVFQANGNQLGVSIKHPGIKVATREVGIDEEGDRYIYNELLKIKDTGKGLGTQVFSSQVENAIAQGFSYIGTTAGGSSTNYDPSTGKFKEGSMNGYYTWPILGYDGPIENITEDGVQEKVKDRFPEAKMISDIMSSEGGAEWWKENGGEFVASFDLRDGSRSRKILSNYLAKKGMHSAAVGVKWFMAIMKANNPKDEDGPDTDFSDDEITAMEEAFAEFLSQGDKDETDADDTETDAPEDNQQKTVTKEQHHSYFEDCPRDDKGHCKPSGQADDAPKEKPKPKPDTPESHAWLEEYMDEHMEVLDKALQDQIDQGGTISSATRWEDVSDQLAVEESYIDAHYDEYYDSAVQGWSEGLGEMAQEDLRGDNGWHDNKFIEWAIEQGFTGTSAEFAISNKVAPIKYDEVHWDRATISGISPETRQNIIDAVNTYKHGQPATALNVPPEKIVAAIDAMPLASQESWKYLDGTSVYTDSLKRMMVLPVLEDIDKSQKILEHGGHTYTKNSLNIDWSQLRFADDGTAIADWDPSEYMTEDQWESDWDREHEKMVDKEIDDRISNAEPPEDLSDEAKESAGEVFAQLSDDEKLAYAVEYGFSVEDENNTIEIEIPTVYKPFANGENYRKTQTVALALQTVRTEDLAKEYISEIVKSLKPGGLVADTEQAKELLEYAKEHLIHGAAISREVWSTWKSSSTAPLSLALQRAAAEELNGHLRMDDAQNLLADKALKRMDSFDGLVGSPELRLQVTKAIMRAHVRATWEASQYVLRKAGIEHFTSYRAIFLDSNLIATKAGPRPVTGQSQMFPGKGIPGKEPTMVDDEYILLSKLNLKKNGAASFASLRDVANNWQGIGPTSGQDRVVIKTKSPRTAAISLPCFGQNLKSEQEVVLAGTFWDSWAAWHKRAPGETFVPDHPKDWDKLYGSWDSQARRMVREEPHEPLTSEELHLLADIAAKQKKPKVTKE